MTSLTPFRNVCPVTYSRFLLEDFMKQVNFRLEEQQHDELLDCLKILYVWVPAISGGGNLAASKIRNLECPSYEICLIDYGCGKFNRKIHIMEQYP